VLLSFRWLTPSSDVFSFGRLLHRVLTGQRPLSGVSQRATAKLFAEFGLLWEPAWDGTTLKSLRSLSRECLAFDLKARPHSKDVHQEVSMLLEHAHTVPEMGHPSCFSDPRQSSTQLSLSFNPLEDGMPILDCSAAFKSLITGDCIGLHLIDMACDPERLQLKVQLEAQLCGRAELKADTMQTSVELRFPTSEGPPVEVDAICSMCPMLSHKSCMVMLMQDVQFRTPTPL